MAKPKKRVASGRKNKHSSRHRPVLGMVGAASSRLSLRQRQIDGAVENAQRTLQERDNPKD